MGGFDMVLAVALIVLVVVGIWAVVELALVLRRARGAVDTVERTVENVDEAVGEIRPVIAKLDSTLDDLSPAVAEVEPLIKRGNVALEALSADLIEVNGVLRDVSNVTGAASNVTEAVAGVGEAASGAVSRLLGRTRPSDPHRTLEASEKNADGSADTGEPAAAAAQEEQSSAEPVEHAADEKGGDDLREPARYFTYGDADAAATASPTAPSDQNNAHTE